MSGNQKKEEIVSLLCHIKEWQELHNAKEVFWFHGYERQGEDELTIAIYPDGSQAVQKQRHTKKQLAPGPARRTGTLFMTSIATPACTTPGIRTPLAT